MGNGDLLDIVVIKNNMLSDVIVSDILDSDHIQIIFHILDRLSTSKITSSELNNNLPGLDRLLKYKKRIRKFWQKPGFQDVKRK
jgi:hypothetical protein